MAMSILFVLLVRASSASLLSFDLCNQHFCVFLSQFLLFVVSIFLNVCQLLSKLDNLMAHLLLLTLILNWLVEIKAGETT